MSTSAALLVAVGWNSDSSHPEAKVNDVLTASRVVRPRTDTCRFLTQVRLDPLIKRSQQGSWRGGSRAWADVDGGLRTVTDLAALLSMLLSPLPGATASASAG